MAQRESAEVGKIRQLFQDLIAPELRELRGDIRALDAKVESVRNELALTNKTLDDKIGGVRSELALTNKRIDDLGKRIDDALQIRERLAAIEARLGATGN